MTTRTNVDNLNNRSFPELPSVIKPPAYPSSEPSQTTERKQ
jgi:hypothetical protein